MNKKILTVKEVEAINNFCVNFILINCKINNIKDDVEIEKKFDKMYNDDLVNIALAFKEKYYPDTEMNMEEFENYAAEVIVGTYEEVALREIIKQSLN